MSDSRSILINELRIMDALPKPLISELENALLAARIDFRRWFDWNDGWFPEVEGELVARGQALGLLEQEAATWLAGSNVGDHDHG